MAHHNVGDNSPFMKRVLIPFWVVRIIIMIFFIIVLGFNLGTLSLERSSVSSSSSYNTYSTVYNTALAIISVELALIVVCLVADIVCIIKRSRRTLTPKFFLVINVFQTALWVALVILSLIGGYITILTVLLCVIILASFIGLLIYSSIIFHKWRTGRLESPVESHQMLGKSNVEAAPSQQPAAPRFQDADSYEPYRSQSTTAQ